MTKTYKKSRIIAGIILILFWGSIAVFAFQKFTASSSPPTSLTSSPEVTYADCNSSCISDDDCLGNYSCVFQTTLGWICRNPSCADMPSCSCPVTSVSSDSASMLAFTPVVNLPTPTPLGFRINAMPNFTPTPTLAPVNPLLSVMPFTDFTGVVGSTFTLVGTSDPYAEVTIQFEPDGIGTITTADKDGAWRHILTTPLSKGTKQLTITARTIAGGKTEIKQSFTVKSGGSSFSSILVGLFLLGGIGAVGFFIYKKQQEKQSLLLSDFPPVDDESGGTF